MAVQAQYPSNVLLLTRGLTQEGQNNYTMQAEAGEGGYIDQPHLVFNNINAGATVGNTNNPGKRNREMMMNAVTKNSTTPMKSLISSSMQPHHQQQQQLIDLTQLNTPGNQNVVVSTGLRLAFGDQRQLQHQQSLSSSQSSALLSLLSEDYVKLVKHQRHEIEQLLLAQGDQLRRTLAEKRQSHYRTLLGAAEESVARKLREKDIEVEKAARRNAELQAREAQLSAEVQVWQDRARAHEATAAALQAQLQQAIMGGGGGGGEEGCGELEAEDAESGYIDPERVELASGPSCKGCGKRVASVVLLPCRHLCVCAECDGVVQACPLCLSFRSSSVEVFLS